MVILAQTKKEQGSEPPKGTESDVSLDMISPNHVILKITELREEAGMLLGKVLELTTSPEISSINLMSCISTLCTVARQRPIHISTVIQSFELLHANLPPHFSSSQINSVTKHLKSQILALLRLPASYDYNAQITTLLTALGCSQSDISKNIPKTIPEGLKRGRGDNDGTSVSKKPKVVSGQDEDEDEGIGVAGNIFMEAIDMTTADLKALLTPEAVTELVMESMYRLPHSIPKTFQHSYTPIAAAGTDAQVTQIARLLASQMTAAGIGIGAQTKGIQTKQRGSSPVVSDPRRKKGPVEEEEMEIIKEEPKERRVDLERSMEELQYLGNLLGLPNIFDPLFPLAYTTFFGNLPPTAEEVRDIERGRVEEMETSSETIDTTNLVAIPSTEIEEEDVKEKRKATSSLAPQKLKKIKLFELSNVVKPMMKEQLSEMSVTSFKRILDADRIAGAGQIRTRLIIHIVTQYGGQFNDALLEFILEDLKSRLDLAVSWLYALYCVNEKYVYTGINTLQYDECITKLMRGAYKKLDSRDRLFTRLVLEAPIVTPNALLIIKSYCRDEDRAFLGLSTLRDLIIKKPQGLNDFLDALLEVTMNDLELGRVQALHIVKKFYSRSDLSQRIERYAVQALQNILSDHPSFQTQQETDLEVATEWTEDAVKICSGLFLTLLPLNCKLLKELAIVYTNTSATVKRILLKLLDQPVRVVGMHSPELLELVEKCPQGAETLIMRMLYILTENAAPSPELVKRVRELYQRNSSDVRFLIPVLHGLNKHEVISALPKFIRLSPNVTKGVFERLLVSYKGEGSYGMSPVTPSELLIALHNIECKGDDSLMKSVIRATNLCFQEKGVYTQEVLAVVLQQLVDHTPIPMLLMRTVIQSLGVCPRLVNFVMTILTKLISKQIWKQPKVWQGFIKCCEVTKPHSFQVILQLPPKQLENLLETSSILRLPFIAHVQALTPNQRAVIPRSILLIIERELMRGMVGEDDTVKIQKKRRESGGKRRHSKESET